MCSSVLRTEVTEPVRTYNNNVDEQQKFFRVIGVHMCTMKETSRGIGFEMTSLTLNQLKLFVTCF